MANELPTRGTRTATLAAINTQSRTVELAFSSEAEVRMGGYYEVLSHAPGACDLNRLNDGGALLWNHNWEDQIGVVERAWIDADGKGRATVRLSDSQRGSEIFSDIQNGIKRHVSVGYGILSSHLSGERDGLDVVTVTAWQPHEISIVSIPADTTVGVGRSARRNAMEIPSSINTTPLYISVIELLRRADDAQPLRMHNTSGLPDDLSHLAPEENVRLVRQPAAVSLLLNASQVDVGQLFNREGKLQRVPGAANTGKTVRLPIGLAKLSQVAAAGAGVIQWDDGDKAIKIPDANGVAWMRRPKRLRVVRPAAFSALDHSADDNAEVTDQSHPVLIAPFDFVNDRTTLAAAFTVKRADRRDIEPEVLAGEIERAIALGLANEVDRLLLEAIEATAPSSFDLVKLAAIGLQLGEVQAITSGHAAAVGADGVLRAAGVPAVLSAQAAGALVGDFTRSALVIGERFDMHARKLGRSGDLEITVLVDVLPVVADPAAFWTVAA